MQPTLMLADSFQLSAGPGGAMQATTTKKCPTGYYYVPSTGNCWPKGMYQGGNGNSQLLRENNPMDYYILVPDYGYVLESEFDFLDPVTWNQVMDYLAPYNSPGVSGLFDKWRERRAERKEQRHQNRLEILQAGGGFANAMKGIGGMLTNIFGGGQPQTPGYIPPGSPGGVPPTTTPFFKTPAGMLLIAAAVGGTIWAISRKKKKAQ